jgi:hypothetical protein
MGVIKHFSSSSGDSLDNKKDKSVSIFSNWLSGSNADKSKVVTETKYESLPNPRPDNYEILKSIQWDRYLIIKIKYLDCTNYEGQKILVFEGYQLKHLLAQKLIDPHFSENKNFISPIARFEPTEKGWKMAISFVKSL